MKRMTKTDKKIEWSDVSPSETQGSIALRICRTYPGYALFVSETENGFVCSVRTLFGTIGVIPVEDVNESVMPEANRMILEEERRRSFASRSAVDKCAGFLADE